MSLDMPRRLLHTENREEERDGRASSFDSHIYVMCDFCVLSIIIISSLSLSRASHCIYIIRTLNHNNNALNRGTKTEIERVGFDAIEHQTFKPRGNVSIHKQKHE